MTFFYKFILWTSIAAVIGPVAFIAWFVWEVAKVPDMFETGATFEEMSAP